MSQIKPFTSVTHQYVNVFALTVTIIFVMSYHGLILYFKLKRFAWLEISRLVINTIITRKNGVEGFLQVLLLGFFVTFLGCLVASYTVLC